MTGELEQLWPGIVGPQIASVTSVEKVVGGVLTVGTVSEAWAEELARMTWTILKRLHQDGWRHIRDIRWIHRWHEPAYEIETPEPWK